MKLSSTVSLLLALLLSAKIESKALADIEKLVEDMNG